MLVEPPTRDELVSVAMAMRHRDLMEMQALMGTEGRIPTAEALVARWEPFLPTLMCAKLPGEPVAVGLVICPRPNVATIGMIATGRFNRVAVGLTRFLLRVLFPALRAEGIHRIDCLSMDGHEEAHRWLRVLGLREEGRVAGMGSNGEAFHYFAWVNDARTAGPRA